MYRTIAICIALLVALAMAQSTWADEKMTLVEVTGVEVHKVKDNLFRVTAKGIVRTMGWVVNLHPVTYVKPPQVWEIHAAGVPPTGIVPQPITSWEASAELQLPRETKSLKVIGSNDTIVKQVPW